VKYASVLILILAGWAALDPQPMSWVFVALIFALELWLIARMRGAEKGAVPVGEAPYAFTAEEARFVERYRFYFTYPALAAHAGSALAAIGLAGMVLALWLTFRQAFIPGALIGANLFLVGRLTRRVAPHFALRVAASRGDREALRMLEILDPLWARIRAANQSQGPS
jgi:hypothetical protein